MYWLIDLPWAKPGMPEILGKDLAESAGNSLTKTQILTPEPDLSYLARMVYDPADLEFFPAEFTIEDIKAGRMSTDTIKNIRHYFLLAEKYEIAGRLIKVTDKYFKIAGVMGVQTVITTSFRLGSPLDD